MSKKDKKIEKFAAEYSAMIQEDNWTFGECAYVMAELLYERNKFAKKMNKLNKELAITLCRQFADEYERENGQIQGNNAGVYEERNAGTD